jgi:hypothetical protein
MQRSASESQKPQSIAVFVHVGTATRTRAARELSLFNRADFALTLAKFLDRSVARGA